MNHGPFPTLQHTQTAGSKDRMARDGQGISGWIVPLPRSPGGEISTPKSKCAESVPQIPTPLTIPTLLTFWKEALR